MAFRVEMLCFFFALYLAYSAVVLWLCIWFVSHMLPLFFSPSVYCVCVDAFETISFVAFFYAYFCHNFVVFFLPRCMWVCRNRHLCSPSFFLCSICLRLFNIVAKPKKHFYYYRRRLLSARARCIDLVLLKRQPKTAEAKTFWLFHFEKFEMRNRAFAIIYQFYAHTLFCVFFTNRCGLRILNIIYI